MQHEYDGPGGVFERVSEKEIVSGKEAGAVATVTGYPGSFRKNEYSLYV